MLRDTWNTSANLKISEVLKITRYNFDLIFTKFTLRLTLVNCEHKDCKEGQQEISTFPLMLYVPLIPLNLELIGFFPLPLKSKNRHFQKKFLGEKKFLRKIFLFIVFIKLLNR